MYKGSSLKLLGNTVLAQGVAPSASFVCCNLFVSEAVAISGLGRSKDKRSTVPFILEYSVLIAECIVQEIAVEGMNNSLHQCF